MRQHSLRETALKFRGLRERCLLPPLSVPHESEKRYNNNVIKENGNINNENGNDSNEEITQLINVIVYLIFGLGIVAYYQSNNHINDTNNCQDLSIKKLLFCNKSENEWIENHPNLILKYFNDERLFYSISFLLYGVFPEFKTSNEDFKSLKKSIKDFRHTFQLKINDSSIKRHDNQKAQAQNVLNNFDTILTEEGQPWDFLVLDILGYNDTRIGLKIAARIRQSNQEIPIVFLTTDDSIIINDEINIQQPVLIKSKGLTQGILAYDIFHFIESIKKSQENYNYNKVFIIYGHGRQAGGFKEKVIAALKKHEVEPILLSPEQVMDSIGIGLVNKMKSCGAFLAICTPDDKVNENWYQPRQNVLLEIGMAMGFSEGFNRLVILQRWGSEAKYQAKLPSDLGGILTISFYSDDQDQTLEKMINALEERKIKISHL